MARTLSLQGWHMPDDHSRKAMSFWRYCTVRIRQEIYAEVCCVQWVNNMDGHDVRFST